MTIMWLSVCLQTYPAQRLRMCSCRTCLWRWPRSGSHLRLHPLLWWCSSRKCRSDRERGGDDMLGTHTIQWTPKRKSSNVHAHTCWPTHARSMDKASRVTLMPWNVAQLASHSLDFDYVFILSSVFYTKMSGKKCHWMVRKQIISTSFYAVDFCEFYKYWLK